LQLNQLSGSAAIRNWVWWDASMFFGLCDLVGGIPNIAPKRP
jgi:hypothetical protein